MIVLSPEGKAQTSAARVASLPRFADLRGKVVGLLDNSKPNADKLEERFEQLLRERFGVAGVVRRRKITNSAGRAEALSRSARRASRFHSQRSRRLRIVHVVEYPRLHRVAEARQVCGHVDHPCV